MVTTEPEIQAAPADSNSNSPIRIKVENGKLDRDESKSASMIDLRFYDKGNLLQDTLTLLVGGLTV